MKLTRNIFITLILFNYFRQGQILRDQSLLVDTPDLYAYIMRIVMARNIRGK